MRPILSLRQEVESYTDAEIQALIHAADIDAFADLRDAAIAALDAAQEALEQVEDLEAHLAEEH